MCGIAAAVFSGAGGLSIVEQLVGQLRHRGDEPPRAVRFSPECALGVARLRIVDPDGGGQPMFNEAGTTAAVFNGEIYNFEPLRRGLVGQGHRFRSTCDTEVVVHLYEELGTELLQGLDGMFAFVLFDSERNWFLAARDRFGVKPLYYARHEQAWLFASELKAFSGLDEKEVQELPPGHLATPDGIRSYYDRREKLAAALEVQFDEAKERVRVLVTEAVRKRLPADLPVGVLFGGGVDSTIVLLLAGLMHSPVVPLVVGLEGSDDVDYAHRVCHELAIPLLWEQMTGDEAIGLVPEIVRVAEGFEPNLIRGSVLSYGVSRLAKREGLKVLLCGEGSDEVFAGYGDFLSLPMDRINGHCHALLADLHRTQLQRVDRTSMAFSAEVREPFLDCELVEYAMSLPGEFKVHRGEQGGVGTTKYILREAFKGLLPEYIYRRPKVTLMEGGGLGKVDPRSGLLHEHAERIVDDGEFAWWQRHFPEYSLRSKEEVWYFSIFHRLYPFARFVRNRVLVAEREIGRVK